MPVLNLQLITPPSLPIADQVGAPGQGGAVQVLDAVNLPWLVGQGITDSIRSIITYSQPSTMLVVAPGQLGVVTPVFTITYAAATGAQTVSIGGVAVPGVPAAGASDTITAANTAAAINASLAHNLVVGSATSSGAVVTVTARWPGPGMNTVATNATTAGGTVQVSGGAAGLTSTGTVGGGTAGVAATQVNQLGIGQPLFP